MDKQTFKFWINRSGELEKERKKWMSIARRLSIPVHDTNCEYGVKCGYCDALKSVEEIR